MATTEERIAQAEADLEAAGGLDAIADQLLALSAEVDTYDPEDLLAPGDEEPTIDCRLRYFDGSWELYYGDASYDTDHRGHWGSSSVGSGLTPEAARELARDLVEQVLDSLAMSDDE